MDHKKIGSGLDLTYGHNLPIIELEKQCNQNSDKILAY